MKVYDRQRPLIFIHVPKAAGTSVRAVFGHWFGARLHEHYLDERSGLRPPVLDLGAHAADGNPPVVYGHFNRLRGFGVEHDYPQVDQFVTILRDPFEAAVSGFHYIKRNGHDWVDRTRVPQGSLRQYLLETPPNMLNHFPRVVTRENYREQIERFFVEVGVMSHLAESVRRIAVALGQPFDAAALPHVNATPRGEAADADLRDLYRERHHLEHQVYEYARARFERPPAALASGLRIARALP